MVSTLRWLPTEWEIIFAGLIYDEGLITRTYRKPKELSCPQINGPMKKWANELNRVFAKGKVPEEMLNIPGHKGSENQNHIKIPPHSC
jgi:hypothetical protein